MEPLKKNITTSSYCIRKEKICFLSILRLSHRLVLSKHVIKCLRLLKFPRLSSNTVWEMRQDSADRLAAPEQSSEAPVQPLGSTNTPSPSLSDRALSGLGPLRNLVLEPAQNTPENDLTSPTYPDPPFFSKTSFLQLGYGVWVNLGLVIVGMAFGYSAVAIPMLQIDQTLNMTETEISWFASILTLSSPVGCVVSGYVCDKLGRRMSLIVAEVPMAAGWLYTAVSWTPINLIIGRAVIGVGLGMIMPPSRVYTSEISLPNMRGAIGTFLNLAMAIGIVVQAVLGMFMTWRVLCFISFGASTSIFLSNFLLPETPYFVLMTDSEDKARKNLQKFRSAKHNIDAEMQDLITFKKSNNIRKLTFKEKMKLLMKPASCIPFWIMNGYAALVQLAGVTVLAFWTIVILDHAKSSMNPKFGNTLVAIFRLFGSILGCIVTYSCRRRTLTFVSGIGVTITFLAMALNSMLTDKPSLLPQICVMACVVFACIGYYSMPLLMMSELYPLQVRGILGGLSVSFMNLAIFAANMAFSPMIVNWGFAWTMIQYAVWSLLGVIVLYFILPETKDLTLQEIEEYYNKKRSSLMSQKLDSQIRLSGHSINKATVTKNQLTAQKSGLDVMKSTTIMNVTVQRNEPALLKSS